MTDSGRSVYFVGAVSAALISLLPLACLAQSNETQRGLDNLRRRMEIKPAAKTQSDVVVEVPKVDPGPWADLKPGMSEGEVEMLLGKPDRTEDEAKTVRRYWDKRSPAGWVRFDKESGRVLEWRYQ